MKPTPLWSRLVAKFGFWVNRQVTANTDSGRRERADEEWERQRPLKIFVCGIDSQLREELRSQFCGAEPYLHPQDEPASQVRSSPSVSPHYRRPHRSRSASIVKRGAKK
jgi:hypothetical protein